jgi:hypothetical protein
MNNVMKDKIFKKQRKKKLGDGVWHITDEPGAQKIKLISCSLVNIILP